MSEMLKPNSILTFGIHKGKTIEEVFEKRPDYLCWMRLTGFSDFGKEVTEAIFAWEEQNPKKVLSIKAGIEKRKKAVEGLPLAIGRNDDLDEDCDKKDGSFVPTIHTKPLVQKPENWGSW